MTQNSIPEEMDSDQISENTQITGNNNDMMTVTMYHTPYNHHFEITGHQR